MVSSYFSILMFGDYLVTSYYTSGVTVIDASDPFNMNEIAYYDTSPDYEGGDFEGCWGAYPFAIMTILATDQQTGLHILEITEPILIVLMKMHQIIIQMPILMTVHA